MSAASDEAGARAAEAAERRRAEDRKARILADASYQ